MSGRHISIPRLRLPRELKDASHSERYLGLESSSPSRLAYFGPRGVASQGTGPCVEIVSDVDLQTWEGVVARPLRSMGVGAAHWKRKDRVQKKLRSRFITPKRVG